MDMEFYDRLDKVEARADKLKARINRLEAKSVHQHVTQDTSRTYVPATHTDPPPRRNINALARIQNTYAQTSSDLLTLLVPRVIFVT